MKKEIEDIMKLQRGREDLIREFATPMYLEAQGKILNGDTSLEKYTLGDYRRLIMKKFKTDESGVFEIKFYYECEKNEISYMTYEAKFNYSVIQEEYLKMDGFQL